VNARHQRAHEALDVPAEARRGRRPVIDAHTHPAGMFVVTEAEAAAIRAVYEQCGEFSAAVELRRLFPAVTDTGQARACARTIAGWKPLPVPLRPVPRGAREDAIPLHLPDCGAPD
jgi:hypothetical protein